MLYKEWHGFYNMKRWLLYSIIIGSGILMFPNSAFFPSMATSGPSCLYSLIGFLVSANSGLCLATGTPTVISDAYGHASPNNGLLLYDEKLYFTMLVGGGYGGKDLPNEMTATNEWKKELCSYHYDQNGNFFAGWSSRHYSLSDAQKRVLLDMQANYSVFICPFTGTSTPPIPQASGVSGPITSGIINVMNLTSSSNQTRSNANTTVSVSPLPTTTANAQTQQNPNCIYRIDGILIGGNGVCPFQGVPTILSQVTGNFSASRDYMVQEDVGIYTKMVFSGPPCESCYDVNVTAGCTYDSHGEFIPHLSDVKKAVLVDLKNNFSIPVCPFTGKPKIPETISPGVHRVHDATIIPGGTINVTVLSTNQTQTNSTSSEITKNQTANNTSIYSNNRTSSSQNQTSKIENAKQSVAYLVELGKVKAPNYNGSPSVSTQMPSWIKNIVFMWKNGEISDNEFATATQYLTDKGIIKFNVNTSK
jgi:hypothetical protein